MIPYLIGLIGSYLIGESMQSENFADGGSISMHNRIQEYQIKKSDGTYTQVFVTNKILSYKESDLVDSD